MSRQMAPSIRCAELGKGVSETSNRAGNRAFESRLARIGRDQRFRVVEVGLDRAKRVLVDDVGVAQREQFRALRLERCQHQPAFAGADRLHLAPAVRIGRMEGQPVPVQVKEPLRLRDLAGVRQLRQLALEDVDGRLGGRHARGTFLALRIAVTPNAEQANEERQRDRIENEREDDRRPGQENDQVPARERAPPPTGIPMASA